MPGIVSSPSLTAAVTQASANAAISTRASEVIVDQLIKISKHLIDMSRHTGIFGPTDDDNPFSPSLRTLFDRLNRGYLPLCSLPARFRTQEYFKACTKAGVVLIPIEERDLADFEDVYYAVLARIREMHQLLHLRLMSKFNAAADRLAFGGPTVGSLHDALTQYWVFLNDPKCAKTMSDAVHRARVFAVQPEVGRIMKSVNLGGPEPDEDIVHQLANKAAAEMPDLDWSPDWLPAFVNAKLDEKYRIVLGIEKQEAEDNKQVFKDRINKAREARQKDKEVAAKKQELQRKMLEEAAAQKERAIAEQKKREETQRQLQLQEEEEEDLKRKLAQLQKNKIALIESTKNTSLTLNSISYNPNEPIAETNYVPTGQAFRQPTTATIDHPRTDPAPNEHVTKYQRVEPTTVSTSSYLPRGTSHTPSWSGADHYRFIGPNGYTKQPMPSGSGDEVEHALRWQQKTERVAAYTQWLREQCGPGMRESVNAKYGVRWGHC